MDLMALSETLKLIFNITHFHPDLSQHFTDSILNIFHILISRSAPAKPLDAPNSFLINALLNLVREEGTGTGTDAHPHDPVLHAAVFPVSDPPRNTTHLIQTLDNAICAYPTAELDATVSPLFTLLRRIYEIAPADVQKAMQAKLLPSDTDRAQPLGKSSSLPSRLLNLSTAAHTPALRDSIAAFMFELSSKDAATYVANVGYGYASGFLLSKNIPMPEGAIQDAGEGSSGGVPVNPITGQRLDHEEAVEMPEMTLEEKEREAERLFVLFERLKKTGVVDVKNPVEEAYRSGRIEELSDSD